MGDYAGYQGYYTVGVGVGVGVGEDTYLLSGNIYRPKSANSYSNPTG